MTTQSLEFLENIVETDFIIDLYQIQCPICYLRFEEESGIICQNNHFVCLSCKSHIDKCPICRVPYNNNQDQDPTDYNGYLNVSDDDDDHNYPVDRQWLLDNIEEALIRLQIFGQYQDLYQQIVQRGLSYEQLNTMLSLLEFSDINDSEIIRLRVQTRMLQLLL